MYIMNEFEFEYPEYQIVLLLRKSACYYEFYIHGSMHHNYILTRSNKMKIYDSYLFTAKLLHIFRVSIAPIIRFI